MKLILLIIQFFTIKTLGTCNKHSKLKLKLNNKMSSFTRHFAMFLLLVVCKFQINFVQHVNAYALETPFNSSIFPKEISKKGKYLKKCS